MEVLTWERGPAGPMLNSPGRGCACLAVVLPAAVAPLALGYWLEWPMWPCRFAAMVIAIAGLWLGGRWVRRPDVQRIVFTSSEVRLIRAGSTSTVDIAAVRRIEVRHEAFGAGSTTLSLTYDGDGGATTVSVPGVRRDPALAGALENLLGSGVPVQETTTRP